MKILIFTSVMLNFILLNDAIAEEPSKLYLDKISIVAVTAICSDNIMLEKMGVSKNKCVEILNENVDHCNNTISPLVPNVTGEEDREAIKKVFASLGELYAMCLKSLAYEY